MRAVIIGNGTIEDSSFIAKNISSEDIVICCDGGSKYLFKEGILPKYIIGDLDSSDMPIITFFETRGAILKKFPSKKDKTDMELCIDFAIGLGLKEILLLGASGTRLDHSLANIGLLANCLDRNIFCYIKDEHNEIYITNNKIELEGEVGDTISLIPFSDKVEGVSTFGLEYSLQDYTMYQDSSLGISNVILNKKISIEVKNGKLLIFKSVD